MNFRRKGDIPRLIFIALLVLAVLFIGRGLGWW
jgi:hypothetical protein